MKNKALIITLIILLSIIIIFLAMFLYIGLKSGFNFKNVFVGFIPKSTNVIYDKQFDLDSIRNIEINQDAGDVLIKQATNNSIQVVCYGEDINDVQVDLNDGILNIEYTHKNKITFFNFGDIKNDIIVYLPSDYSHEINITNNCGQCDFIDLENATVNISCDAGGVQLGKVKNANISCDYGNVEIKEVLNRCDIQADCGNIEIDKISIQEDSSIKADLGNVEINNANDIYIDAEVDLGNINIDKNNRLAEITLKIYSDCGNIEVKNDQGI